MTMADWASKLAYDQPDVVHPIDGHIIAHPTNEACFDDILPKEAVVVEKVKEKVSVPTARGGLAAMSDVKDLTSQMVKKLALGIKDNVEDIAAAFKKMAIINPHRERVRPAALPVVAAVEEAPAPVTMAETPGIRTVDAQNKQALYEGLLQRTIWPG